MGVQALRVVRSGKTQSGISYTDPSQIYKAMEGMRTLDREHFRVLHLDGKNRIVNDELVSIGSLNQAIIHPREVFKGAVLNGSAAIVCVHNHPTGDTTPSQEDIEITARLKDAGELLGIRLLDHVIIGDGNFYSFAGHGWAGVNSRQTTNEDTLLDEKKALSKGLKREGDIGDRLSACLSKLKFLSWTFSMAASNEETMNEHQLEGLAWIANDIRDGIEAALECQFYKEVPRGEKQKAAVETLQVSGAKTENLMRSYLELKAEYPDKILVFRIGDFYEMFLDDAVKASRILGIVLSAEGKGRGTEGIPLCGFPVGVKDDYVSRLVAAGEKVAICEPVW